MASMIRKPLLSRTQSLHSPSLVDSPSKLRTSTKRARSPDPQQTADDTKRHRSIDSPSTKADDRERRRAERESTWRAKYLEHFPRWNFYFDLDALDPDASLTRRRLETKVKHLGAHVEEFYSDQVTHLIVDQSPPLQVPLSNKENMPAKQSQLASSSLLKSPIKLREDRPPEDDVEETNDLILNAIATGRKIWSSAKLGSVLDRCFAGNPIPPRTTVAPSIVKSSQRSLVRLLESERLHGATTERDPTQKRHDYVYFSKHSCFVLIEDLKQELAPIAALEYPITKGRDGKETGSWPVLYCHPQARGPFIEFDEKEKRWWVKAENAEKQREADREKRRKKFQEEERKRRRQSLKLADAKSRGDLRRTVSMTSFRRQVDVTFDGGFDHELDLVDLDESAKASGYLASTGGYMAASGNSVGITSTTGTTSTTEGSLTTLQLPTALRGRMQQEVVTSRKFPTKNKSKEKGTMGPPVEIPDRRGGLLRKSRSTNTMRLPKRDEGTKPGYCESCRMRFNDFKEHTNSRKHRKFAADDANYAQLDSVLGRLRRRTLEEKRRECDYEMRELGGDDKCQDSDL